MSAEEEVVESQAGEAKAEETGGEAESVKDLPQWAQREIAAVRSEAARYRTANKELTDKLAGLKTPEEVEAAVSEAQGRVAEVEAELALERARARVRGDFPGIPADVFELIRGGSEDELRSQAEAIAGHFSTPSAMNVRPRGGGLTPAASGSGPFDARAAALSIPRF